MASGEQAPNARPSFLREMRLELFIHDMKDPVSVIETGVRTLLERRESCGSLSEKQEKILKRVLRNAQKTRQMLVTMLEIGRSEAGCLQCHRFSPVRLVFDALIDSLESHCPLVFDQVQGAQTELDRQRVLQSNGIDWQVQEGLEDMEMERDPRQFTEVVSNLFKNALQYRKERLGVMLKGDRQKWILEVCDDGPGISAEDHDAVFERYMRLPSAAQTIRDGHGVGLAGARIMARGMGGDIQVVSSGGSGTTFRFYLPL